MALPSLRCVLETLCRPKLLCWRRLAIYTVPVQRFVKGRQYWTGDSVPLGAKAALLFKQGQRRQQQEGASSSSANGPAEWREGQLFPEGWENMDAVQKAAELYSGALLRQNSFMI